MGTRFLGRSTRVLATIALALYGTMAGSVHAGDKPVLQGEMESFGLHEAPREVPEGEFTDADGKALTLADFRGKVILVNFWATWCAPCREEMPSLANLQQDLGGEDFQVVAISTDRKGAEVARPFLEEVGAEALTLYLDPGGGFGRTLGIRGLPATLLIGPDGREVGRMFGPAEWDSDDAKALIQHYISGQS